MELINNKIELFAFYKIHGIYGDVEFTKSFKVGHVSEIKEYKLDYIQQEVSPEKREVINFDVSVYESDTNKLIAENIGVSGLPFGINKDDYYRMAKLKKMTYLNIELHS